MSTKLAIGRNSGASSPAAGLLVVNDYSWPVEAGADGDLVLIGELPANGLHFVRNGRYVYKDPVERWLLRGVANGLAGWFRLVGNEPDLGQISFTAPRIDGAIGLDDGAAGDFQMRLPTLAVTPDTSIELGDWWYAIPPL